MKKRIVILCGLFLMVSIALTAQTPDWLWAEKAGGSSSDEGYGISTDADGNVYVTGWFSGTASFGSFTLTSSGDYDIFVAKMDADGNWLWAKKAGGSDWDEGKGISTSANGDVYVTGYFKGSASFGSFTLICSGDTDIFVAKLSTDGNWLWAKKAGGSSYDKGKGISISAQGNIYVTGYFSGTASFGSFTLTGSTNLDYEIFVAKMDEEGNWLWAKKAGGSSYDVGYGISTYEDGNVYITGYFSGTASFGSFTLTSSGSYNEIFVAKIDENSNWLWAEKADGSDNVYGYGISTSADGNVYVTGNFYGTASFGSYTLTSSGSEDIFVAKISADGNWLWAEKAGGSDYDIGYGISTSADGNAYVTGWFSGTASFGSFTLICSGDTDIFVAEISVDGNWLWAEKAGGTSDDIGYGICTSADGNIYVTGFFAVTASFGSFTLTSSGSYDIFVAKLNNTVSAENEISPSEMGLSNYPNPFNPVTNIKFYIKENETGILSIFNLKGQIIETQRFNSGIHDCPWDAKDYSSGLYFYRLHTESCTETKKMLLMK